jgi:pilus assembly protein Flp/PilA
MRHNCKFLFSQAAVFVSRARLLGILILTGSEKDLFSETLLSRCATDESGATAIEYALIGDLISAACVGGGFAVRNRLWEIYVAVVTALGVALRSAAGEPALMICWAARAGGTGGTLYQAPPLLAQQH